jgi:hypothetical protein
VFSHEKLFTFAKVAERVEGYARQHERLGPVIGSPVAGFGARLLLAGVLIYFGIETSRLMFIFLAQLGLSNYIATTTTTTTTTTTLQS